MNHSIESLNRRLEELEHQLAFQDELHETLNAIVARQDGEILELKRRLVSLSDRLRELGNASAGGSAEHEVPPHY